MSYVSEKVAYLNGLMEGLGIGDATPEGKMIGKIVEVLEDMAQAMDEMDEMVAELDERVDELDIDLSEVEDELYGEDECDCGCEDEDFLEIVCPHCNETINFDQDAIIDGELVCPVCNQEIFPDTEEEE